jgi:DNA repair ATPase RecN
VEKRQVDGRPAVSVTLLGTDARRLDIAQLLAGRHVTPAVLENAAELLRLAGESESKSKGESRPAKARAVR